MDKLVGWLILIAIASAIFVLFYYLLWLKIEVTAKYLVSIMTIIAVVYVGYDLLITVFSYGTWAVFFKKLVGSIIIILPISYMLYWLEKLKIKKLYEQKIIIEKRNAKIMGNNTNFLKDDEIPF
jgi:purine-cytosine permease-like protein